MNRKIKLKRLINKSIFVAEIFAGGLLIAQKNTLKLGVNGGMSIPSENTTATFGFDVAYQNRMTDWIGLGVVSGYTQYFAKENEGINNNHFGVIPVAVLVRIYPLETGIYFGADAGYGFVAGYGKVACNYLVQLPNGGIYVKPEIGYHTGNWSFSLQYQKLFTGDEGKILEQKFDTGNLGIGVSFHIPLGR